MFLLLIMKSFDMKCKPALSLETFCTNITLVYFTAGIVLIIKMISKCSFGFENLFTNVTFHVGKKSTVFLNQIVASIYVNLSNCNAFKILVLNTYDS